MEKKRIQIVMAGPGFLAGEDRKAGEVLAVGEVFIPETHIQKALTSGLAVVKDAPKSKGGRPKGSGNKGKGKDKEPKGDETEENQDKTE